MLKTIDYFINWISWEFLFISFTILFVLLLIGFLLTIAEANKPKKYENRKDNIIERFFRNLYKSPLVFSIIYSLLVILMIFKGYYPNPDCAGADCEPMGAIAGSYIGSTFLITISLTILFLIIFLLLLTKHRKNIEKRNKYKSLSLVTLQFLIIIIVLQFCVSFIIHNFLMTFIDNIYS